MQKLWRKIPLFYFIVCLYMIFGAYQWVSFPKGHLILWFNGRYSEGLNLFFKTLNFYGDGLFSLAVIVGLLFVRYHWAWMVFLAYGLSSLLAQFLKRVVFPDMPRPKSYFPADVHLNFVDGVEIFNYHSFPSGHTTSAFALSCILCILWPQKWLSIGLGLVAVLAGLSRVYLAQHFIEDTMAGCLIGTFTATAVYVWQGNLGFWQKNNGSLLKKSSN